ncbi:unnamed protein product [Coffea canephora]|uniref:Uncharacterized protein n=1 Tax=Coffea canephora TaxID=49390 RepID=A0A068TRI1_COFCA|nr:unnamed protein product [Coffea canephora]
MKQLTPYLILHPMRLTYCKMIFNLNDPETSVLVAVLLTTGSSLTFESVIAAPSSNADSDSIDITYIYYKEC